MDINDAIPVEPIYLIRYLVFEDYSRKRAYVDCTYWGDDGILAKLYYGYKFTSQWFEPEETEEQAFVVVNRPKLVFTADPENENEIIGIYDVFLAPLDQWRIYELLDPEEVTWEVEIFRTREDV